ncbi:MAG: ubiquitin-like small modifier protein 1 [Anaerolineales bacterium]
MSTVRIPTPLRPYAEGQKEIDVQAETVGGALDDLTRQHPGLRQHLYDEEGQLRAYVNVFLNEDDIRGLDGSETPLDPDDRITIVPSIAGGLS